MSGVLDAARGELGTKESPAGSNRVKYNAWFYGREVSGSTYPWCMAFVQWCFAQAGTPLPYKTASCSALLEFYQQNEPKAVKTVPRAGDIAIYTFGHTGIVESVGNGSITAIEGNTSPDAAGSQSNGGMVCRKTRRITQVTAFIRPEYEMEEEMFDVDKLTDAQVLQLANRMQTVLAALPASKALEAELEKAKASGITDGRSPNAFATRIQTAAMISRAMNTWKPQ